MAINLDSLYWLVKERIKDLQGFNIHIADASNSNPIVIKTDTNHNYETGRHVVIDRVKGNAAANGNFFIRVTSPIEFELYKQVNSVQGATDTSPIVMTIVGHNFNTADRIRVQGIEGNLAANGSFYVRQQGVVISNTVGTPILTIDTFSNTDTIVITKTSHGLITGDRVQIFSPDGVAAINGIFYANVLSLNTYQIYRDATFTTTVDGTTLGAYEGDSTMQKYSAIVVTCVGHGFANKDGVKIIDVVGEPNAIGGFYIKVLDTNTFELYSDIVISVPVLGTGTYVSGGIAALLNNYNLELYIPDPAPYPTLPPFAIPSVGSGVYLRGGTVLSRAAIGNGTYNGDGIVVKEVNIQDEFKDTFPEVPANVYDSIVKRIRS